MSPVFKDMFTIGESKNERSQEISLQEESRIVDLVLRFIDPKKETPDLDFDVLPELLEAGRKYQICQLKDRIFRWMNNNASTVDGATRDLSSPKAIQLLEQGITYGVPRFCQLALRSLVKKPYNDVFVAKLATSDLYEHLVKLRAERVRWFQTKLEDILGGGASIDCPSIDDKAYMDICKAIMRSKPTIEGKDRHKEEIEPMESIWSTATKEKEKLFRRLSLYIRPERREPQPEGS
ncbi:hypothetical protein FRC17_008599 [Serendipita sp. 399]|nr:hypothetical protein FRC17_008599 [Serendipita sp. 399]